MNCSVVATPIEGLTGATTIDVKVGVIITFNSTGALETVPDVAVISVEPGATPVASPPGDVIVAMLVLDDDQAAEAVTSCVLPFP
jgi:hypothetical protein